MSSRHIIAVCALLTGIVTVSCSKDTPYGGDSPILLRVDAEGTRAAVIDSTSIQTAPGKFILDAYVDRDVVGDGGVVIVKEGTPYIDSNGNENVEYNSSTKKWDFNDGATHYWVENYASISFWSYTKTQNGKNPITIDKDKSALYPTAKNVDPDKGVKMVFDYSLPANDASGDATNQEDLIFAYNCESYGGSGSQAVKIHFYHALAQVRFAFSTDDNTFTTDHIILKSIAIGNVASGGTCTFFGNQAVTETAKGTPSDREVEKIFMWSDLAEKKSYDQPYNVTFVSGDATYDGWTKGEYKKESHPYNLYTCQNVFMMLPQTLADDACIRLTIVDTSVTPNQEHTYTSYINGDTWKAGKYYTYKLNYSKSYAYDATSKALLVDWGNNTDVNFPTINE